MIGGRSIVRGSGNFGSTQRVRSWPCDVSILHQRFARQFAIDHKTIADDIIVYNTAKNHQSFQDELVKLEMWEDAWNMEFYTLKCQQITFLCKRQPAEQSLYLHDTMIPKSEQIKYLEVTLIPKQTGMLISTTLHPGVTPS